MRAQLDSFAAQTGFPDELVVGDDRSSDAACDIVRGFAERALFEVRLKVIPNKLGLTRKFIQAMPLSTLIRAHDNCLLGIADRAGRMAHFGEPLQFYPLYGANTSDFLVNRARVQTHRERLAEWLRRRLARFTWRRGFERECRFHAAFAARLEGRQGFGTRELRRATAARLFVLAERWGIRTRLRRLRIVPSLRLRWRGKFASTFGPIQDSILSAWGSRPDGPTSGAKET